MLKKRVEDSLTEQTYLVMHRHINGYGRLFGGQLLAWIDELAGIVSVAKIAVTDSRPDSLWSKAKTFEITNKTVKIHKIFFIK